ncbi:hypothetical protein E2K80_03905 [Rhodophyticola sp. CCM32]|uniref:hypothetical protein n=1 Tax=Rhodophyticola sp. CCM32 TaxID=2916397 RepID=UPI00107F7808|nr:hypothetical protein [Rhodophyticola sp. CCM32]QBX99985.1 hypothetical protein E2K80_03905 [Rhodophyticola sp. CCM32]
MLDSLARARHHKADTRAPGLFTLLIRAFLQTLSQRRQMHDFRQVLSNPHLARDIGLPDTSPGNPSADPLSTGDLR